MIDKPLAGAVKIWDGYPPGNDHLSHLGKRNIIMCFGDMGYVSFEEGIYIYIYIMDPSKKKSLEELLLTYIDRPHGICRVAGVSAAGLLNVIQLLKQSTQ